MISKVVNNPVLRHMPSLSGKQRYVASNPGSSDRRTCGGSMVALVDAGHQPLDDHIGRGVTIMSQPSSALKDKHYDLVTVLRGCLRAVWRLETYKDDALREGDTELAEWFGKLQDQNREAGEVGKRLLADRLLKEGG
jgi:hypothetical protein